MGRVAVVLGATGIAGRALVRELERDQWKIFGVSRRPPNYRTTAHFVEADLNSEEICAQKLGALSDATHVFWAAYSDAPQVADTRVPNARMFRNSVAAIEVGAKNLEHVCLLQGTKYYGQYLGPFKTPAKETDKRVNTPHYYYDQEDFLLSLQAGKRWTYSMPRPHIICGSVYGTPLNVIAVVAAYASIRRELGLPLSWPGRPNAFRTLYQATDATLLAKAMIWMSTTDRCANQAFNITNGDYFRYENLWPAFAEYFGLPAGEPEPVDLVRYMADKKSVWQSLTERHSLVEKNVDVVADWNFANYAFSNDWDVMSDTLKCRTFGFNEFVDSQDMFLRCFDELRGKRVIP